MILYSQRSRHSAASFSTLVGVFEDDVLLLRLAERSRQPEPGSRRDVGCFGPDDLGFEREVPVEAEAWDF